MRKISRDEFLNVVESPDPSSNFGLPYDIKATNYDDMKETPDIEFYSYGNIEGKFYFTTYNNVTGEDFYYYGTAEEDMAMRETFNAKEF